MKGGLVGPVCIPLLWSHGAPYAQAELLLQRGKNVGYPCWNIGSTSLFTTGIFAAGFYQWQLRTGIGNFTWWWGQLFFTCPVSLDEHKAAEVKIYDCLQKNWAWATIFSWLFCVIFYSTSSSVFIWNFEKQFGLLSFDPHFLFSHSIICAWLGAILSWPILK